LGGARYGSLRLRQPVEVSSWAGCGARSMRPGAEADDCGLIGSGRRLPALDSEHVRYIRQPTPLPTSDSKRAQRARVAGAAKHTVRSDIYRQGTGRAARSHGQRLRSLKSRCKWSARVAKSPPPTQPANGDDQGAWPTHSDNAKDHPTRPARTGTHPGSASRRADGRRSWPGSGRAQFLCPAGGIVGRCRRRRPAPSPGTLHHQSTRRAASTRLPAEHPH
jgi:hypothetical protein